MYMTISEPTVDGQDCPIAQMFIPLFDAGGKQRLLLGRAHKKAPGNLVPGASERPAVTRRNYMLRTSQRFVNVSSGMF